jgi:predicted NUDIX family NTP pyrophosphohydrolase
MKEAAGTLLYRRTPQSWEVLLVHPSGAYNRRAPWSIPKGVPDPGESLLAAARRETVEETGVVPGELVELGHVDYRKSRKRVHAFAGPAPGDAAPLPASWEVDQAAFVPLDEARLILHPDQAPLVDRLAALLAEQPAT